MLLIFGMVIQCMDSIRNVILYGYSRHGQHQECYFVWLFTARTASGMLFCMVIQCTDSIRNVFLYGSGLGILLRSAIFRQSVTEYWSGFFFLMRYVS